MNNERRKQIKAIIERIAKLDELKQEIYYAIEEVRNEEQEALENLPDSIRYGARGEEMESRVDALDRAMEDFEEYDHPIDNLEEAIA